jgi:hypothetical protein
MIYLKEFIINILLKKIMGGREQLNLTAWNNSKEKSYSGSENVVKIRQREKMQEGKYS